MDADLLSPRTLGTSAGFRHLISSFTLSFLLAAQLLAAEAFPHRRRGPQVNLVPLIVGVGTTVDRLQLRAEELVLPKPESRLLLDVLGGRHCGSIP